MKRSKVTGNSIESTRLYHERYLRAMSSPLRRGILRVLKEGPASIGELSSRTEMKDEALKWHLNILENGHCIEKVTISGKLIYKLTQEGRVVDYME